MNRKYVVIKCTPIKFGDKYYGLFQLDDLDKIGQQEPIELSEEDQISREEWAKLENERINNARKFCREKIALHLEMRELQSDVLAKRKAEGHSDDDLFNDNSLFAQINMVIEKLETIHLSFCR